MYVLGPSLRVLFRTSVVATRVRPAVVRHARKSLSRPPMRPGRRASSARVIATDGPGGGVRAAYVPRRSLGAGALVRRRVRRRAQESSTDSPRRGGGTSCFVSSNTRHAAFVSRWCWMCCTLHTHSVAQRHRRARAKAATAASGFAARLVALSIKTEDRKAFRVRRLRHKSADGRCHDVRTVSRGMLR